MLVEKWMLQAGNCLLKNGRRRTSIAFYNLEMVIRHKNRMKAEALLCRNVVGMLFNFIGNTVIHSCVKVELSYECFLLGIHTVRKVCGGYQPATAGF